MSAPNIKELKAVDCTFIKENTYFLKVNILKYIYLYSRYKGGVKFKRVEKNNILILIV